MSNFKANTIHLNKNISIHYEDDKYYIPLHAGMFSIQKAIDFINNYGSSDKIHIVFSTIEQYRDKDIKIYTKRLNKIADGIGYTFENFKNVVIDGYIFPYKFETYLTRKE